jgi:hypothetical protein
MARPFNAAEMQRSGLCAHRGGLEMDQFGSRHTLPRGQRPRSLQIWTHASPFAPSGLGHHATTGMRRGQCGASVLEVGKL